MEKINLSDLLEPEHMDPVKRIALIRIVDDDGGVRESYKFLIESEGWRVKTYPSAEAFLEEDDPTVPGCGVFDVRMTGITGMELHQKLIELANRLPVIFVSAHGDIEMAVKAMRRGAVDFLTKPVVDEKLLSSIDRAVARSCEEAAEAETVRELAGLWQALSPRECQVAQLAAEGLTTKAVSDVLGIAERTAQVHVAHVCSKLGVENAVGVAQIIAPARPRSPAVKRLLRSDGIDVIVVGSGLAGLSAALTVAEFGYSPVILEKACEPGGLTRRAYGFFNAADARRQIALGIDDSPEKHLRQALEVSRGKAREPLMRTLCYEAYSTLQWLEAFGLEFEPGIRRVLGGVYPRTHMPLRGAGEAYLSALRSALRPFGVPIVCNAEVTALRKSGDAVTGVEGLLSGEPFRLTSRLGVVLAGGGFSRNMEMMRLYAPGLSDVLPALDEGADGSLIQAAADIGAALVGMSYFEVRLFASTLGLPGDPSDYILVNARGERFMREDRRRSTLAEAVVRQPDGMAWMVINAPGADPLRPTTGFRETVIATISGYNYCIRTKGRDSLGRDPLTMRPIGPGVEIRPVLPRILWSYGGLEINEKAEVIDRRGRPMKGLAAAGDITGGIHGEHALMGDMLASAAVFGRIAARTLVKNGRAVKRKD